MACAAAAPSAIIVQPLLTPGIAIPSSIPTISPGDLQAAAIDAKVQAEDQARALVDQAREVAENAGVEANARAFETNDQLKEKAEEAFWANEERKWRAYDALNTAQAQIDGSVAGVSPDVAKSFNGAAIVPAPVLAPVAYSITPGLLTQPINAEEPVLKDSKPEESKKEELPLVEVKTGDLNPEKVEEKKEEKKDELKAGLEDLAAYIQHPEKAKLLLQQLNPQLLASPILAAPVAWPQIKFQPFLQPITTYLAPGSYSSAALAQFHSPILAPAIVKTW